MKYLKILGLSFLLLVLIGLSLRASIFTPSIWLKPIANNQTFEMAVHISRVPDMNDYFIVTEKGGKIFLVKEGSSTKKTILDHSKNVHSSTTEEGMLSAQIDPLNPEIIYVYYCVDKTKNYLSRFKLNDSKKVLTQTEEVLFEVPKAHTGHNGGDMKFGEDGYLWISIGEASFAAKKKAHLIDGSIVGTILRIDVRNKADGKQYSVPSDNPFVNNPDIPSEVWAMGLRNPWRWNFIDKDTIIVGDVGDRTFEEISILKKGEHGGWPYVEGLRCGRNYKKCDLSKYKPPVTAFDRAVSRSITGGFYYRGDQIDAFKGKYVFADYLRGIMTLPQKDPPKRVRQVYDDGYKIVFPKIPMSFGPNKGETLHPVSFFEDENKELIVVTLNGGVFRIINIDWWTKLRAFLFMLVSFR